MTNIFQSIQLEFYSNEVRYMYASISKLLFYSWMTVGVLYGIHIALPYLEKLYPTV